MGRREDGNYERFMKRKGSMELPSYFSEHTVGLEELREILDKEPASRTDGELDALVAFSKNVKFFAELRHNLSLSVHLQCCQMMTYTFADSGTVRIT